MVGRQFFDRTSRHSAVKLIRFGERLVHERFGPNHAEIRESRAPQHDAICSDKTVVAYPDGLGSLTVSRDVDAVGHDLRLKTGHRAEFANGDRVRAVDEMTMSDGGVLAHDQLRFAIRFLGEMARRPEWKTGDPVAAADHRMSFEMEEVEAFAKGQMINATPLFHDQARRIDPGETDAAGRMDFVTELLL